jgi:hypothetical protein
MRAGYRVLRGADPLETTLVERGDLRQALERELRGKLVRLRQGYAAAAGDEPRLGEVASASASTILVLLRSLLTLAGRPVPTVPAALAGDAADLLGASPDSFATPVAHRGERGWRCKPAEFEQYLDAVALAAGYVDQLQLGDQR